MSKGEKTTQPMEGGKKVRKRKKKWIKSHDKATV